MSKKEECQGCIGFTDEHTCEGWADFQAMKVERDKCPNCVAKDAEIERLTVWAASETRRAELLLRRIAGLEAEIVTLCLVGSGMEERIAELMLTPLDWKLLSGRSQHDQDIIMSCQEWWKDEQAIKGDDDD